MRKSSLAHVSIILAAVSMVLVTVPAIGRAQSVSGALGASATILPPDRSRPPELLSMSVARGGVARLETAPPIAGAVSQIVMVTVSSPTNSFAPVVQAPTLVMGRRDAEDASAEPAVPDASRVRRHGYEVKLDRSMIDANSDSVAVRINYLIVPGT